MGSITRRLPGLAAIALLACDSDTPASPETAGVSATSTQVAPVEGSVIPAGNGAVIHSCVLGSGVIKVVAADEACQAGQTPLAWSIAGPQGLPGPEGPRGPVGVSGYEVVVGETAADNTPSKQLQVNCPTGKKAFGAGWSVLDPTGAFLDGEATAFVPAWDGGSWLASAKNGSAFAPQWKLRLQVVCASITE